LFLLQGDRKEVLDGFLQVQGCRFPVV
jgi:hypothetical protein